MRLNVHPFTLKLLRYRPKVVCFVGKKIWDVYESVAGKTAGGSGAALPGTGGVGGAAQRRNGGACKAPVVQRDVRSSRQTAGERKVLVEEEEETDEPDLGPAPVGSPAGPTCVKQEAHDEVPRSPPRHSPGAAQSVKQERELSAELKSEAIIKLEPGLDRDSNSDPAHLPSTAASSPYRKGKAAAAAFDWTRPRSLRLPVPPLPGHEADSKVDFTYFWVVPNTSGLERTPLSDQVVLFGHLRSFLERLKGGPEPGFAAPYRDIDVAGIERTVEAIRQAAASRASPRS